MSLFKNFHLPAWLLAGVLFLFAGCGGSDDDSLIVVRLDAETVNCNTTSNRIIAVGDAMTFVATILSQDVGDAWCSFSSFDTLIEPQVSKSGHVGTPMNLYLLRNETDQVREALIRVTFANGFSADLTLRLGASTVSGASSLSSARAILIYIRLIIPPSPAAGTSVITPFVTIPRSAFPIGLLIP